MASTGNVQKTPSGQKLNYFSRFYDSKSSGTDLFLQKVDCISNVYCFPPIPIIGMVIKFLEQNKLNSVLIIPAINASWVNLVSVYISDLMLIAPKGNPTAFTVLNNEGSKVPRIYKHSMLAVKLDFHHPCCVLQKCIPNFKLLLYVFILFRETKYLSQLIPKTCLLKEGLIF